MKKSVLSALLAATILSPITAFAATETYPTAADAGARITELCVTLGADNSCSQFADMIAAGEDPSALASLLVGPVSPSDVQVTAPGWAGTFGIRKALGGVTFYGVAGNAVQVHTIDLPNSLSGGSVASASAPSAAEVPAAPQAASDAAPQPSTAQDTVVTDTVAVADATDIAVTDPFVEAPVEPPKITPGALITAYSVDKNLELRPEGEIHTYLMDDPAVGINLNDAVWSAPGSFNTGNFGYRMDGHLNVTEAGQYTFAGEMLIPIDVNKKRDRSEAQIDCRVNALLSDSVPIIDQRFSFEVKDGMGPQALDIASAQGADLNLEAGLYPFTAQIGCAVAVGWRENTESWRLSETPVFSVRWAKDDGEMAAIGRENLLAVSPGEIFEGSTFGKLSIAPPPQGPALKGHRTGALVTPIDKRYFDQDDARNGNKGFWSDLRLGVTLIGGEKGSDGMSTIGRQIDTRYVALEAGRHVLSVVLDPRLTGDRNPQRDQNCRISVGLVSGRGMIKIIDREIELIFGAKDEHRRTEIVAVNVDLARGVHDLRTKVICDRLRQMSDAELTVRFLVKSPSDSVLRAARPNDFVVRQEGS